MMTIRAMRLNGEMLELKLSDSELADLRRVRDLKVRLAAADPSGPCPLTALLQLLSSSRSQESAMLSPRQTSCTNIMCVCVFVYVYVCIYIYIYMYICIYVYMYMCSHTYIHTHRDR